LKGKINTSTTEIKLHDEVYPKALAMEEKLLRKI
jgi:hypothetical protein